MHLGRFKSIFWLCSKTLLHSYASSYCNVCNIHMLHFERGIVKRRTRWWSFDGEREASLTVRTLRKSHDQKVESYHRKKFGTYHDTSALKLRKGFIALYWHTASCTNLRLVWENVLLLLFSSGPVEERVFPQRTLKVSLSYIQIWTWKVSRT